MSNKKFAEYQAGLTIGIIIVYFIFFSYILYAVGDVDNSISGSNNDLINFAVNKINGNEAYCSNPRYRYDYESTNPYQISTVNDNYLRCDYTEGIFSQSQCNNKSGCIWREVDTTSWFYNAWCFLGVGCADAPFICDGYMNVSSYGISTLNYGGRVAPYLFLKYYKNYSSKYDKVIEYLGYNTNTSAGLLFGQSGAYDINYFKDDSICMERHVIINETLCNQFLCTWNEAQNIKYDTSIKSQGNILSMVFKVFTFQYNFGFENESINLLCYLIFIFIPLLVLVISLIYAFVG